MLRPPDREYAGRAAEREVVCGGKHGNIGVTMNVSTNDQGNVTTISLEGSVDGKTAPLIREEMRPVLEKASNVILDMSKVDYLSSAGLRLLLLIYREFTAKNGKFVLVGVAADIQTVMSHTGFLKYFSLAGTQVEAMRAFA